MIKVYVLSLFLSLSAMASEIIVEVNGMVCSLCAQGIEKKFKSISDVKDLKVDLGNKVVYLTTVDKADLSDAKIKEIITDSGYNVASIERK